MVIRHSKRKNELYNEEQRTLSEEMADVLEEEMEFIKIIKIESVLFEEDLIRAMSQLRVVIDLGDEPDLYLQISAISAGVPQINMIETDYVTSNVNGLIIPSSSNMIQALLLTKFEKLELFLCIFHKISR